MNDDETTSENLRHIRTKLSHLALSTYRVYNRKDHRFENLSRDEYEAFMNLASNDTIIIQKSDKGNSVVIIDKVTYIKKMEDILSDKSKFQQVKVNNKHKFNKELRHLIDLQTDINTTLKDLVNDEYLSKEDYDFLKPVGSRPGILYGLCKVHKQTQDDSPPFRPILSAIGTCTYNLAKFFVPILAEYTTNDYTVKDSFSFAEEIRKQNPDLYMASFDVDSLFTNVPLDETITICLDLLFQKKRKIHGLLRRHAKVLLDLATKKSCFRFNDIFYKQVDGVAMGSPLGPTLANIFLSHHEQIWLNNCPVAFKPLYYRRYVDDVFVLFRDKSHVLKFKEYLNKQHKNIHFTHEEEKDNNLSFLDILVTRDGEHFLTSLYRKATFSGVYTNFQSFIPLQYKHGLLFTLLYRAYTISSNFEIFHNEICTLKTIWLKNAYPLSMIDKCILKYFNKIYSARNEPPLTKPSTTSSTKGLTLILPFLGKASLEMKSRITHMFKDLLPSVKVNVILSSKYRLSSVFKFKDKIPDDLRSHILYKFSCTSCNAKYIGETTRHLKVRLSEHLALSYLTERNTKPDTTVSTPVTKHCHGTNAHLNDPSSFKIVGQGQNEFCLRVKESLLIHKDQPSLNKDDDSTPLYLFF